MRWASMIFLMTGVLLGQSAENPGKGLQIRNVSAYTIYYSNSQPNTGGLPSPSLNLGGDLGIGGSTEIGWTRFGERSSVSFHYTPSYIGRVRYSGWNALNHAVSLNAGRKLTPRLNFTFSVGGDFSSVDQFLFSPTAFSTAASVPSSFDDISGALLSRRFDNPQLASVLSSASLADSPARNLLYGQRMFTSGVQSAISYSRSPRFSIFFGAGGSRSQRVSENRDVPAQSGYLVPNTTSGSASLGFAYALSPVTQLGVSLGTNRVVSSLQDAYSTTSTATLGRTFANRWILQIHGGVGVINPVREALGIHLETKPRPLAGGSLGFKTFEHTLLGSYSRTVSDSYGVGASTSSSAGLGWRWSRPGRSWWLDSSVSWEQLQGSLYADTSSWRITTGLSRAVGRHMVFVTQYAFLGHSATLQRAGYKVSQSSVRLSMQWTSSAIR